MYKGQLRKYEMSLKYGSIHRIEYILCDKKNIESVSRGTQTIAVHLLDYMVSYETWQGIMKLERLGNIQPNFGSKNITSLLLSEIIVRSMEKLILLHVEHPYIH